jgi:hypothetical protein
MEAASGQPDAVYEAQLQRTLQELDGRRKELEAALQQVRVETYRAVSTLLSYLTAANIIQPKPPP